MKKLKKCEVAGEMCRILGIKKNKKYETVSGMFELFYISTNSLKDCFHCKKSASCELKPDDSKESRFSCDGFSLRKEDFDFESKNFKEDYKGKL